MANKTFKLFADKMGGVQASNYIGIEGDIFYDPTTTTLRISDGATAGGNALGTGGGTTDRLVSGSAEVILQSNGYVRLSNGAQLYDYGSGAGNGYGITDSLGATYIGYDPDDNAGALHMDTYNGKNIRIRTTPVGTSNYKDWLFSADGSLTFPDASTQNGGALPLSQLKTIVAAATSFAEFQTAIAAL